MRTALVILVVAVCACPPAWGAGDRAATCPGGVFGVAETLEAAGTALAVHVQGTTVSLEPLCPPVVAAFRALSRGTRVRARWTACPGLDRPVTLRARIDAPGCTTMRGRLRLAGHRSRFSAACTDHCGAGKPLLATGCRADMEEPDCEAHAGDYDRRGLSPEPSCHCRTEDGGTPCERAGDCEGMCIAPLDATTGGQCSEHVVEFGCFTLFDDAGTPQRLCAD
jgi:hypothetical protein